MINSSQDLSQFSSVVVEHFNAAIRLNTDIDLVIPRRETVQSMLAKLLGYKNTSELYQELNTGLSIEPDRLASFTKAQILQANVKAQSISFGERWFSDIQEENDFVASLILTSIKSAIACYRVPGKVTVSEEFKEYYPTIIGENRWRDDTEVVYLSLVDHKLYPFTNKLDINNVNRIMLDVPSGLYVEHLISRLNTPYATQIICSLHNYLPIVGFLQCEDHKLNHYWLREIFDDITRLNIRANGFTYHHELLQIFVTSDPFRQTTLELSELNWSSIAYLYSNNPNPFEQLRADLPKEIVLNCLEQSTFTQQSAKILLTELLSGKFQTGNCLSVTFPDSFKMLFKKEYIESIYGVSAFESEYKDEQTVISDANKLSFQIYNKKIHIEFIGPDYRLWINHNQYNSHRVDYLLNSNYCTLPEAQEAAMQFLAKHEDLEPDYNDLSTTRFTVKIVDVSQFRDIPRDRFLSAQIKGGNLDCINFLPASENSKECYCSYCKWERKIDKFKQCGKFAFISGSGLSTTRLRYPILVTENSKF